MGRASYADPTKVKELNDRLNAVNNLKNIRRQQILFKLGYGNLVTRKDNRHLFVQKDLPQNVIDEVNAAYEAQSDNPGGGANMGKSGAKLDAKWNMFSALVREIAIREKLTVPKTAADRIRSFESALELGWSKKDWLRVSNAARTELLAGLFERVEGESEKDIRLKREKLVLKYREDIEREYESGKRKIRYRENNEQLAISTAINERGIECVTEKDYADLLLPVEDGLGEIKVDPDKQSFATAMGELLIGETAAGKSMKKFILSVGRKTPKSVIETLTRAGISSFSKIGEVVTADLLIPGHETVATALGVA